MRNKTKYQWLALVTYSLGVISETLGWFTKSWWFIFPPFGLWSIALWCVVFKPVRRQR